MWGSGGGRTKYFNLDIPCVLCLAAIFSLFLNFMVWTLNFANISWFV